MNQRILITGSSGLVGTSLTSALRAERADVTCLDIRPHAETPGDVLDRKGVDEAVAGVDGIIHLAAVSRVVWGERDPELCWTTNVVGLHNVLNAAAQSAHRPWLIFASSREVYGQPEALPATEDSPLCPVNIYGRSKVEGERLVVEARGAGVRACTIRLSNVFGSVADHADRVVPAFARAAALGAELRVDGCDHTFDFTHLDDVTRGIVALVGLLAAGEKPPPPIHFVTGRGEKPPPPIHFVTGRPTTLGDLAHLAARLGASGSAIRSAAPRDFDVARFFGDPSRAKALLGWQPRIGLEDGLARLIRTFRDAHRTVTVQDIVR